MIYASFSTPEKKNKSTVCKLHEESRVQFVTVNIAHICIQTGATKKAMSFKTRFVTCKYILHYVHVYTV